MQTTMAKGLFFAILVGAFWGGSWCASISNDLNGM
jgi:hypothetical protein